MASVVYLQGEQVQSLHLLALELGEAGHPGLRSEHELYSSIHQVQQGFGEADLFPTIPEKAAAYGYYLTVNHPFIDGNKRTAALVLETFLDLNGYDFDQTDDEMADMFVSLAANHIDQSEFFGWVCNHARARVRVVTHPVE